MTLRHSYRGPRPNNTAQAARHEARALQVQKLAAAEAREKDHANRLRRLLILGTVTDRLIRESSEDHRRFLRHLDRLLSSPDERALFDLPKLKVPTLNQQGDSR